MNLPKPGLTSKPGLKAEICETRVPGKSSGYLYMMVLFHIKIDAIVKILFLILPNLFIFAPTPFTFWTPIPRGRHVSKKA